MVESSGLSSYLANGERKGYYRYEIPLVAVLHAV